MTLPTIKLDPSVTDCYREHQPCPMWETAALVEEALVS